MKALTPSFLGLAAMVIVSIQAPAQVSYPTVGSSYSQDFDTLPNTPENQSWEGTATIPKMMWKDDTAPYVENGTNVIGIPGWYLYHPTAQAEGGYNDHQRMRIGAGTANTGAFMSWGASSNTERALGSLASNTLTPTPQYQYVALKLRNDTGSTLGSFTLAYSGEQWRDGGAATPVSQSLLFAWSTTAGDVSDPDTSFTSVPELGFASPVFANTGSGAAVDGNGAGKVIVNAFTVENIVWAPGTDLWLRWSDLNDSGNDHGFGIDDLTFSAALLVPEPTSFALLGLGFAALLLRRRN